MKVLVWIFSEQYGLRIKLKKVRRNSTSFGSLGLYKISEKFSWNNFFLKFYIRISTAFRTKSDKFQVKRMSIHPRKKMKQFHTQKNLPFSPDSEDKKIYCRSCGTNLRLKSLPKPNRHSEECLFKIWDQKTQGVICSKSQTESEQNWFSINKTSWLSFPVYFFCDLFMEVCPYLGANNIWKYSCEFFKRNKAPE